jgi:hypothetical protein
VKLEVVSYEEAQKTIDNLNKVGEGVQGLSAKGAEAAAQINAASAQASSAIEVSGKQINAAIPAWGASLGKVVTGLSGAIAGISGISGGMMMVGGGTYETLMGLSGIFGGIASVAGAFGGLSKLGGGGGGGVANAVDAEAHAVGTGAAIEVAAKGASFANGIAKFAKGGTFSNSVVSSPTLFKFANGGITRNGLMGEAGPEAIMPLTRGSDGRLGVDATGLPDAIAEARDALDDASDAMLQGTGLDDTEAAKGSSGDSVGPVSGLKSGESRVSGVSTIALSDSRGAVESIRRIVQENSAKAAAAPASLETKELHKLLTTKNSNTTEITNNQANASAALDQLGDGSQQQASYGDAISAARNILTSEIGGGETDQQELAPDAITNSREFTERITDRISSPQSLAAAALSDSRGAVESIRQIAQENSAKAAAITASPEIRELHKLLATKDSSTTREITNNQVNASAVLDQPGNSSQQQASYGDAISAARNVLASEISEGETDQAQQEPAPNAITNSREFIEKITDRMSSPESSSSPARIWGETDQQEPAPNAITNSREFIEKTTDRMSSPESLAPNAITNSREFIEKSTGSVFGDSRNAITGQGLSQSAISTKETISAIMQARDTKETSNAISQTREVLSSVSSMNKEKNMERVMETNATAVTKPLDIKYESQVINSVEYVTVEQHQRGLSQAAERGRALALNSLKNSVKARRQVGI